MTLLSSTQTSWLLYPPAYTVPGFSPGFFTPAFRPGLFRLFFAQSLAQSNLSGTEIVVMAMAAIAAIAVTQMIILFITASTFCFSFRLCPGGSCPNLRPGLSKGSTQGSVIPLSSILSAGGLFLNTVFPACPCLFAARFHGRCLQEGAYLLFTASGFEMFQHGFSGKTRVKRVQRRDFPFLLYAGAVLCYDIWKFTAVTR